MRLNNQNLKYRILFFLCIGMANSGLAQINIPSYGEGITIKAEDGSTQMNFGFRVQSLFTMTDPGKDDIELAMLIRRSRLKSDGYFFDKRFGYKFEMGLSNRDMGNNGEVSQTGSAPKLILDAVFKYKMNKTTQIWFGQTKLPGNRERVISSQKLQFVDRSLVNSDFNIDRDFGVWITHAIPMKNTPVNIDLVISSGEGRNITINNNTGLSYTGRVEVLPLGAFTAKGDYFGSDLERELKPKVSFGLSYNFNQSAQREDGQLGKYISDSLGIFHADLQNIMADMIFKYKGWSVHTEYAKRTSSSNFESSGPLSSNYSLGSGFNAQAGYMFKSKYELAFRYTQITAAQKNTSLHTLEQYTLGLSKYIFGHNLKVQTDFSCTKRQGVEQPALMYRFQIEMGI